MADRSGALTINTKKDFTLNSQGDAVINCVNSTVTASGDATLTSSGTTIVEGSTVKLGKNAMVESVVLGESFKAAFAAHIHPTVVGPSGPPSAPLPPTVFSKKVKVE